MTSVALGGRGRDEGSPGIAIRSSPRAGGPWVWCSDVCHGLRSVSGVLTFNVFLGKSLHSWHARADWPHLAVSGQLSPSGSRPSPPGSLDL